MSDKTTVVNIRGLDTFALRLRKIIRIDRRSMFGNPFIIDRDGDRDQVCDKYQLWFDEKIMTDAVFKARVHALKGKILGCWCKPERCHGDTIVAYLEAQVK